MCAFIAPMYIAHTASAMTVACDSPLIADSSRMRRFVSSSISRTVYVLAGPNILSAMY
jgi:hypothetical protein